MDVGHLRAIIADLPSDMPVVLDGPDGTYAPGLIALHEAKVIAIEDPITTRRDGWSNADTSWQDDSAYRGPALRLTDWEG